jgi:hypothetical protein
MDQTEISPLPSSTFVGIIWTPQLSTRLVLAQLFWESPKRSTPVMTAKRKGHGFRVVEDGSRPEPKLALRDRLRYIRRIVNSSIVCGKGAFGPVVRYIVESAVTNHNELTVCGQHFMMIQHA